MSNHWPVAYWPIPFSAWMNEDAIMAIEVLLWLASGSKIPRPWLQNITRWSQTPRPKETLAKIELASSHCYFTVKVKNKLMKHQCCRPQLHSCNVWPLLPWWVLEGRRPLVDLNWFTVSSFSSTWKNMTPNSHVSVYKECVQLSCICL